MDTGLCIVKYAFLFFRGWFEICVLFLLSSAFTGNQTVTCFFCHSTALYPPAPSCNYLSVEVATGFCSMFGSTHSSWVITSSGWKDHFDCHFSKCLFCFGDLSCSMLDVKFPFKALICRQTLCQLRFVNVNFTPSVPIQFVIPRVEDRDESWWIKVGLCIKRETFWKIKI